MNMKCRLANPVHKSVQTKPFVSCCHMRVIKPKERYALVRGWGISIDLGWEMVKGINREPCVVAQEMP